MECAAVGRVHWQTPMTLFQSSQRFQPWPTDALLNVAQKWLEVGIGVARVPGSFKAFHSLKKMLLCSLLGHKENTSRLRGLEQLEEAHP